MLIWQLTSWPTEQEADRLSMQIKFAISLRALWVRSFALSLCQYEYTPSTYMTSKSIMIDQFIKLTTNFISLCMHVYLYVCMFVCDNISVASGIKKIFNYLAKLQLDGKIILQREEFLILINAYNFLLIVNRLTK